MSGEEILKISTKYLAKKNFYLNSRYDNQIVFIDGKDINIITLILSFLIFFIGGILYYLLSKTHTISINFIKTTNGLNVSVEGNTKHSRSIAKEFLETLNTFDIGSSTIGYIIQEIKCPKCGSSIDYKGEGKIVQCSFCGSSLSINKIKKIL